MMMIPSFSSNRPSSGSLNNEYPLHLHLFKSVVVVLDLSWVYLPIIVHWWQHEYILMVVGGVCKMAMDVIVVVVI